MISIYSVEWQLAAGALGRIRAIFVLILQIICVIARFFLGRKGVYPLDDRKVLCSNAQLFCAPKQGLRVLFAPSDNSAASGAFRSLVTLVALLRDRYAIEPLIVLPYEGDGTMLLDELRLPHIMIPSRTWTYPIGLNLHSLKNARAVVGNIFFNHIAINHVRYVIRQFKPDLVHINTTWTYVCALAAFKEGIRLVWHLREYLEEGQQRTIWNRGTANALMAKADAAIAISEAMRSTYERFLPHGNLIEIPNGVDEKRFLRSGRKVFLNMPYTLLLLGNFAEHKGHVEFSQACAKVFSEGLCNFRVWFVGGGSIEVHNKCKAIFDEAGMSNHVTYWGFQKNPERFLEQADISFSCCRFEAWGRVTAEAMMAGCLVIGADTGATPELIEDGKSGLLYHLESGKYESLASKIKEALLDINRSQMIAYAGQTKAAGEFTASKNADRVFALYKDIVGLDNSNVK